MLLIKKFNKAKINNSAKNVLLTSKAFHCFCLFAISLLFSFALSSFGIIENLAFSQVADETIPTPGFGEILSKMSPMLMMVFFIFYFLVVRPQNKKLIEQQKLLGELKKGDNVLTTGGMHAKVFSIESDHIILEPSVGVKLKFDKTSIASRIG